MFSNIIFLNENTYSKKNIDPIPSIINENGYCIKNCSVFVTDELIESCMGNDELLKQAALLEGAKIDWVLKNFLKEGEDYKGLKKDLKEIIRANDLDDRHLKTEDEAMHICKRILQVSQDLAIINGGVTVVSYALTLNPAMILGSIIGFVIGFIINRLLRYSWDTIEFDAIKKDSETIVSDLRRSAKKATEPKIVKKLNNEADRLEEAIEKYSKKNKDN